MEIRKWNRKFRSAEKQFYRFEDKNSQRVKALDNTVDAIRMKYGSTSVIRAVFIGSSLNPLSGGIGDSSYPVMSSIL